MRMKDSAEPIEFFNPGHGLELEPYIAAGDKQGTHHLGRYHWATLVVQQHKPARILDMACGTGYGSFLIARNNPDVQVVGGDYDERAIMVATAQYRLANLEYCIADAAVWKHRNGRPLGGFDAVVSFDTIEHLVHRELFLINIVEHLSQSGFLLLSTPVRSQPILAPAWAHHKVEYDERYLYNLIRRFFRFVVRPTDYRFPQLAFWQEKVNFGGQIRYLLRTNPLFCLRPIKLDSVP
jgi:SAM-dependent methyltransferase